MSPATERSGLDGARTLLVRAVALASLLLLATALVYAWSMDLLAQGERARASARQAALAVSTYGSLLQSHAEALARTAAVSPSASAPLVSGFPGVQTAQFLALGPLGTADPAFRREELRNNVELRLASRAFNGEQTQTEAYRDGGEWFLMAAAAVNRPGAGPRGVVFLRANLAAVARSQLPLTHEEGEFSLWARGVDDDYLLVARPDGATREGDAAYRVATGIPSLYAGFDPAAGLSGRMALGSALLTLTALALSLVTITLTSRRFRSLAGELDADTRTLTSLALHQRSTTATLPALHWKQLTALGETLVQLRRDAELGGPRHAARAAPAEPRAPEFVADALEIAEAEAGPLEIPSEIFRDYDIRGRAERIPPALAHAIGQAIGSEALERDCSAIVVGTDGRDSSPALREHLVNGLLATGIDVIDVGTVATPMLYFACHHLRTMSGVMVTGSHNPADHNGFKVMIGGETLRGEGILALRERIESAQLREGQGSYRVTEIDADYIKAVADDVLVDSAHRVVIDCGNGAASVIAEELFRELGCDVVPLFCELDSRFPNHHPDPAVPENLRQLVAHVAQTQAALGIAFDGDADRIGVVSASGTIVTADRLMMLFARELLSRHPGADVVFDVKCSRDLPAVVTQNGGRPIMCRSGHSWIKEKMKESGALLGGEFTGHICFRDRWFGFDDALYCAARLLEILATENRSLDELLDELPRSVATPEIRIEVDEERKFALMKSIAAGFSLDGARLSHIDGIRAEFSDGWGLVRASNTSAALICRFEGRDGAALERIRSAFLGELRRLLSGTNVSI